MEAHFHQLPAVWDPNRTLYGVPYPSEFWKANVAARDKENLKEGNNIKKTKGRKQYKENIKEGNKYWKDKDSFPEVLAQ